MVAERRRESPRPPAELSDFHGILMNSLYSSCDFFTAEILPSDRMVEMTSKDQAGRRPAAAREASLKPARRFSGAGALEIVVPYSSPQLTAKVVERAGALGAGLDVRLKLVAVYVAPYPAELRCPAAMERHLTARLTEIAERASLPASLHLVVSRDRLDGLRRLLRPGSAVLLGTRKRFWRTREERLARDLTRQGHQVSLIHFV